MRTIVLGPPGTGKTTTLLNKVDDFLNKLILIKLDTLHLHKKLHTKQETEQLKNLI